MMNDTTVYHNFLLIDLKINDYLIGLFHSLKMPTSNYVIRRFLDNFVVIESDIYFVDVRRFTLFLKFKYYFSYFIYRFKIFLSSNIYSNSEYSDIILYNSSLYNVLYPFFSINLNSYFHVSHILDISLIEEIENEFLFDYDYDNSISRLFLLYLRTKRIICYQVMRMDMIDSLDYLREIYTIKKYLLF